MSIAIITGASSGMGAEFAKRVQVFFPYINEIWLIARRRERLESLAATIPCKTRIIQADITSPADMRRIKRQLQLSSSKVSLLVNSAGFGIMGKFQELSLKEQTDMIELNCKALLKMTYMVLPHMHKNARIIQLASVAAFLPQPKFAVYAATKSFVLSFSRALNEELRKYHIIVTAVCPGPVKTEFFDIAEKYSTTMSIKKYVSVTPDVVADGALKASLNRRAYYTCTPLMKWLQVVSKVVPHSLVLKTMSLFY